MRCVWVYPTDWECLVIRCKFKCNCIHEYDTAYTYQLSPVYGSNENKVYWDATPSGSIEVCIVKDKGKLFEVGKAYYIDITEV